MKKRIIAGTVLVIFLVAGFLAWKFFLTPLPAEKEGKYLFVKTGSTMQDVQHDLVANHFAKTSFWFRTVANIVGYKTVKPGRYKITQGMSLVSLVRMLKNGHQSPVNFVITRIRTKESLAAKLGAAFECDSASVIEFMNSPDSLQRFPVDTNTVMTLALPLTYEIRWNTTPGKIFQQFYNAYKNFWTDDRKQKAENLHLTPAEATTLASIIDEETNAPSDRPNIASVYLNRIAKGIPLQADPTVKFALKDFSLKRIYESYTRVESPYNTYVNKGLPPGPICTPGLETVDAVLNSPKTDYMYFVANSDFSGTHVFTTNYDDHMKYARLYQQELNKRNVK